VSEEVRPRFTAEARRTRRKRGGRQIRLRVRIDLSGEIYKEVEASFSRQRRGERRGSAEKVKSGRIGVFSGAWLFLGWLALREKCAGGIKAEVSEGVEGRICTGYYSRRLLRIMIL
jgi:hypothetical protein